MQIPALATALSLALALPQEPPPTEDPLPSDSLEAFLERVFARRAEVRARLAPRVSALVLELENKGAEPREASLFGQLEALGPEARPLLVAYLEPGGPDPRLRARAERVARFLAAHPDRALADGLGALVETASEEGRRNALVVLGFLPPDPVVDALLERTFRTTEGELHRTALEAVARRTTSPALLRSALADPDPKVRRTALSALAQARVCAAHEDVEALLADPPRAAPVLAAVVAFYRNCPDALDDPAFGALLGLLLRSDAPTPDKVELLEAVPEFRHSLDLSERRAIEPVLEASDPGLREAGLVCMALMGNRSAKRRFLEPYDRRVDERDGWPRAYENRGDAYLRVHEASQAIKDYRQALQLLGDRAVLVNYRGLWIKLARAYVQAGRLRQALDALEEFGIDAEVQRRVREDPAFRPLLEHSRYGRAFR